MRYPAFHSVAWKLCGLQLSSFKRTMRRRLQPSLTFGQMCERRKWHITRSSSLRRCCGLLLWLRVAMPWTHRSYMSLRWVAVRTPAPDQEESTMTRKLRMLRRSEQLELQMSWPQQAVAALALVWMARYLDMSEI